MDMRRDPVRRLVKDNQDDNLRVWSVEHGGWVWIVRGRQDAADVVGKYLFFHPDRDVLIDLACDVMEEFDLHVAKVPVDRVGGDWVLCVYDVGPRFAWEMVKYDGWQGVKYRHWKSDEATRRGEYSEGFRRATGGGER